MKAMEKLFKALDKVAFTLAAVSTGGMLICVFLQVIARTTGVFIPWTTELSQYCFLWSTCFASYVAARRGKLIGVEVIQKKLPDILGRIVKFIAWAAGALFYGLVIYFCAIQLPTLMVQYTPIMKISMGLIYITMMIGLGLLCVYVLYVAVLALTQGKNKVEQSLTEKTVEQIVEEVE